MQKTPRPYMGFQKNLNQMQVFCGTFLMLKDSVLYKDSDNIVGFYCNQDEPVALYTIAVC
jgi:hypothetical protein